METAPTPAKDFNQETITFSLPKKDLFFIGQTLSTKYINSDIAPFINKINRVAVDAENLDADVSFTMTIELLFDIIQKLGREPEFYYSDFNATIKAELLNAINLIEDEELQLYIIERLTLRAGEIENYKNALIQQYIRTQGL